MNLNKIFYLGCNDQKDCIRIEGRIEQCDNAFVIKDYESARIMPAKEYLLKSITAGYIKWQSDTPYGTDEFNANHTYELGGNEGTLSLSSELIGSGYLIEKIRRQSEPTKDYPTDEDIFIVCVLPTGAGYVAETTENFENEAGIISPTTAYNLRITPSRIMDNWQPYWDNGNDAVMTSYEGNAGLVATCTDECTAKAEVAENETKVSSGRKSRGAFELVFRGEWPLYNKIGSCVRFDYCGRQYTGYLRSKHMNVNILKKGEIILKGILT